MAQFNPDPPENLNNYLNYSRGSTSALVGVGNLFKDKADLVIAEANASKANIELAIDDQVRAGITPIRDAATHALETGQLADSTAGPNGNIPSEVTSSLARMSAMSEAKAAGRLNESHYFNLLDAKAREIRAQHPGFRDYVDQRIAALTGSNPANRLVSELYSEAKALASSRSATNEYWLKQVYETGGKAEYDAIIKSGRTPTEADLREIAMNRKAATVQIDNTHKRLSLERENRTDTVAKYKESASTEAGVYLTQMVRSATGPVKMFQQKLEEATKAAGPGGQYKPEQLAELNQLFNAAKMQAKDQIQMILTRQNKDMNGQPFTYASKLVDDKDRKDILNLADEIFAPWEQALYSKDSGKMHALALRNQMTQDGALDDLMSNVPWAKGIYALQKTLGPAAGVQGFWNNPNIVSDYAKLRYEDGMWKSVSGQKGAALKNQADEAAKRQDKESTLALINEHVRQLSDPKVHPETYKNMMNFIFSDANKDFLSRKDSSGNYVVSTNDSYNLYTKLVANPTLVKNIVSRKDSHPEEYAKFREFTVSNFQRLMKTNGDEANRLISNSDRYALEYNGKTGMFRPVPFERSGAPKTGGEALVSTIGSFMDNSSIKAVEQLNKTMLGVSQLIKAEGGDPLIEVPKLIKSLGIDTGASKQGFTGKVVSAMEQANPKTDETKTVNGKADSDVKPPKVEIPVGTTISNDSNPTEKATKSADGKWRTPDGKEIQIDENTIRLKK